MQNIDDYIKTSINYAVEKMGGYPGDAIRIYRSIITQDGFDRKIRKRPVSSVRTKRVNPIRSTRRLSLTDEEKTIFDIIYLQTDTTFEQLESDSRKREIVDVRKKAMVVFAVYLDYNLKQAGALFGGRDHSTVIHAINTHDDLLQSNSNYAIKFKRLLDEIKEQLPQYFNTTPVSISDLRKEFDQAKWERFATRWVKQKRDKKELEEIKQTLLEYERTKKNQHTG
jgi:hypothetical protein